MPFSVCLETGVIAVWEEKVALAATSGITDTSGLESFLDSWWWEVLLWKHQLFRFQGCFLSATSSVEVLHDVILVT